MLPLAVARAQQSAGIAAQDDELPIHARYLTLFRRLVAELSDSQNGSHGGAPSYRAILQGDAGLSSEQIKSLVQIASDCMQKVAEIDHQAREITQVYRNQNRSRGQSPEGDQSSPPSSLKALTQQRDDLILQAREQVRLTFGQAEFERFDRYVASKGGGRRVVLPSRNKQPLLISVTVAAVNSDGIGQKQFTSGARIFVEIKMANESAQAIAIKSTELYDWFQLLRLEKTGAYAIEPLPLFAPRDNNQNKQSPALVTEIKPGGAAIVGRIELGAGVIRLPVGQYRCVPHERVVLNRPPDNSEFLRFEVGESDPITFEIIP